MLSIEDKSDLARVLEEKLDFKGLRQQLSEDREILLKELKSVHERRLNTAKSKSDEDRSVEIGFEKHSQFDKHITVVKSSSNDRIKAVKRNMKDKVKIIDGDGDHTFDEVTEYREELEGQIDQIYNRDLKKQVISNVKDAAKSALTTVTTTLAPNIGIVGEMGTALMPNTGIVGEMGAALASTVADALSESGLPFAKPTIEFMKSVKAAYEKKKANDANCDEINKRLEYVIRFMADLHAEDKKNNNSKSKLFMKSTLDKTEKEVNHSYVNYVN